ncbi:MAG: hypothetical protein D9V47_04725 [Clostridia bacterium]|nr:MAG: hypothetical protein D9V47_04725 [Clostridia bacterium]
MGKIKSAMEIALERSRSIGAVSDQEAWELKARPYRVAGQALAERYLSGEFAATEIEAQLQRQPENFRPVTAKAFLEGLLARMGLENTGKVLEAVVARRPDSATGRWVEEVKMAHRQYHERFKAEVSKVQGGFVAERRRDLARSGIKGSAIKGFPFQGSAAYQRALRQANDDYRPVVEQFRRFLLGSE